jgi:hypothetical protein
MYCVNRLAGVSSLYLAFVRCTYGIRTHVFNNCSIKRMCIYDIFTFAKLILSKPSDFEAIRDNLIQGYANKYSLQHFLRNGLLSTSWFVFEDALLSETVPMPTFGESKPTQIFYGVSQGGILGGGYVTLSGTTGLIDRAILESPGTPFALIMTRTIYFEIFKAIALLNIYNSRHLRIFLSMMQMGWDVVEGSGALAAPVQEPYPRVLLHAGLGDVLVPALSAEGLARAFSASVLPNNPIAVYGVPVGDEAGNATDGPYVTLTELLYEKEYTSLPIDNLALEMNGVHFCVREDPAILLQTIEFINTGRVLNPCAVDSCHRTNVRCSFWPR